MFYYRGMIKNISVRNSTALTKALQMEFDTVDAVPIELNVEATLVKEEADLFWRQCCCREEDESKYHIYDSMYIQYIIPGVFKGFGLEEVLHLTKEGEPFSLNLTRRIEMTFECTTLELPTKTLKNGQLLKNQTINRVLHLITPEIGKLHSVAYM